MRKKSAKKAKAKRVGNYKGRKKKEFQLQVTLNLPVKGTLNIIVPCLGVPDVRQKLKLVKTHLDKPARIALCTNEGKVIRQISK